MADDFWATHEKELAELHAAIDRLYWRSLAQTKDLKLVYLEAGRLPREILIAKLRQAIVIAERTTSFAFRFTEASRRLDALRQVHLWTEMHRSKGAKGGAKNAATTRKLRDEAVRLAFARQPEDGWLSAPKAADAVMDDLKAYANVHAGGRMVSRRKVEEWLRDSGIKRGGHAQ